MTSRSRTSNWNSVTQKQKNEYKLRGKEYIDGIRLSEPCKDCGETDPVVKQFHHRNPEEKLFTVGNSWHTWGLDMIVAEVAKCDVLCANCHLKRHAKEGEIR